MDKTSGFDYVSMGIDVGSNPTYGDFLFSYDFSSLA